MLALLVPESSPFLTLDRNRWVASNDLAFAIRDGFPVTEGHTLVIARRVVATWFDATPEEQRAVLELVEVVKQELDELYRPDGYNVGFNAGEAAGQTVMHLHVHVIPRYRGDMDDPRGGVRHVIPHKGNYKRLVRSLAVGGDADPLLSHLLPLFHRAAHVAIVAAFVQQSGLDRLRDAIDRAVARGASVRILTGDYLNITQAAALEDLVDWAAASVVDVPPPSPLPQAGGGELGGQGSLEARIIEVARLEGPPRAFHPKSWRFESESMGVLFVGSSNISRSALESGIEWNLRVDRDRDADAFRTAVAEFERLWAQARVLDAAWVADYARRARSSPLALPPGEELAEPLASPPDPHAVQRAALTELARARERGQRRSLAVLATGLGKTWLAAFDVAVFAEEMRRLPRVLFLAHRREILVQAARTFRTMLRPLAPRVSWFVGPGGSLDGDLVFASVQKLARRDVLSSLDPRAFDYVIVDEVHHATAESYRRILDHLEPAFVLGLTATPERSDEADVLGLFDDNLAFRADVGRGIELEMLVPFVYFGIKDEVDYANIPWRNRRFDPEALAAAVQTEHRMERMWEAWTTHVGRRTLVFCASVAHADFVRDWLRARGVEARSVHSQASSDPREESLAGLAAGTVSAVCSVDVFNEGIDVPAVDRVVMLRPTESPVVFLQQLGRGLRKHEGKDRLVVIDFVGNHKVFLDRVRRLLSLAGGERAPSLRELVDSTAPVELPHGCSVDVELEAKELLRLLVPRGRTEVERVYRELRESRGERPTAGELQRMGYSVRSLLTGGHGSWFAFVESEKDLDEVERRVLATSGAWLREIETTAMTRSFKMVVLQALLEAEALTVGMKLDELARRCWSALRRSPELFADVPRERFEMGHGYDEHAWAAYWRKNPIDAWAKAAAGSRKRLWFRVEDDRLLPLIPIAEATGEVLARMTRELVDYRLAQYRARHALPSDAASFDCKVTWNKRDPILKLPSLEERPDVPRGELDVRVRDGRVWRFRFAKEFCNRAHPVGDPRNRLPDLMREWFGPNAGHPGTDFRVRFSRSPDGWWIERLGEVIAISSHRRFVAYPSLRAAAGAAEGAQENIEAAEVVLPIEREGDDLFAIRATGSSMDGGARPIRDGDWLLMRWARGSSLSAIAGRVALVQVPGEEFADRFQIKRVVRTDRGWVLRSDNPDVGDFAATEETTPIAVLVDVLSPDALGPPVGAMLGDAELESAFGLSDPVVTGRIGGHAFVLVEEKGAFEAPDRMTHPMKRHPGETLFVLARTGSDAPWRYCGVARWREDESTWALPPLDHATWSALGEGRTASRRLEPEDEERARAWIEAFLARHAGSEIEADGRRTRVVGPSGGGGIRIAGEGFAERTVSLSDIAWVLIAKDDVAHHGGLLDEQRVNRLRYLEGTPKASTRWIDTGWAIALVQLGS